MATNRSCAKSQEMRSKRKWEITTDLNSHYHSTRHESRWKDGTRKHITCYSCGHQGHYSHECPQRNASLTASLGSSDRTHEENLASEEKSLTFNSYQRNVESRYVQDQMSGIITCLVCGKEGHYTCDCPMKDQEGKVICTLCSKKGHCRLWCCQQNKSDNHACTRCGEIGHSASTHGLDCSSCDKYHPLGECRMSKVTCLMCESRDHFLAQCPLNSVLTTVLQDQRENFRGALLLALTKQGSALATPSEPSKESELCEKIAAKKPTSSVKCFSCGEEGHRRQDCPSKPKVPTPNESSSLVTADNIPTRVFGRLCLNCHEEGHYAKHCPLKLQDVSQSSLSEESNTRAISGDLSKELKEHAPSTAKHPSKINLTSSYECFNCGVEGHRVWNCPLKQQLLTPNKSRPLVKAGKTRACYSCGEVGHYAQQCPLKRQKCQDYRTKSSR